jgi:hypothetical protein
MRIELCAAMSPLLQRDGIPLILIGNHGRAAEVPNCRCIEAIELYFIKSACCLLFVQVDLLFTVRFGVRYRALHNEVSYHAPFGFGRRRDSSVTNRPRKTATWRFNLPWAYSGFMQSRHLHFRARHFRRRASRT